MLEYFDVVAKGYDSLKNFPLKKLEIKTVLNLANFSKEDYVLDVGCGSGIYLKEIEDKIRFSIGLDNSKGMIAHAKKMCKKSRFVLGDAEKFSLKWKFDKILCLGVLEFCENPKRALQNCSKHLRKRGKLILLYPKANLLGYFYKLYHLVVSKKKIHLFRKGFINNLAKSSNLRKVRQIEFSFLVTSIYEKI